MTTPQAGTLVNPLSAINQEAYDEAHGTAIKLGVTALTERVTQRRTRLDAALEQVGEDFNTLDKVTGDLKGDTPDGTFGRILDEHSGLAADMEVLNQQRAIRAGLQRRAAADGNYDDDPIYDQLFEPVRAEPPMLSRRVQAMMTEQGVPNYVAAHRGNLAFDLDVDPRIYADLTRGSPGIVPNQWDSAASPPWSDETARTVMLGRARLSMLDLIPSGTIGQAQHIYYREVSPSTGVTSGAAHTVDAARASSSAAARAEGAALAETNFMDIRVADTVESIGHRAKVSMEQLEDSARVQSMLDTRMPYGVRQAINRDLLNGNGTSPKIKGLLAFKFSNAGGSDAAKAKSIQESFSRVTVDASDADTNAKAGKALMLAARSAMTTLLIEGDSMATGIVMHPTSVENVQITETSAAGFYYGDPRMMPAKMLWGMPIVEDQYGLQAWQASTAAGMTVALLGDFAMQAEILYRSGVRVEFGLSQDDFDKLVQSVRAYVRAVLSVYRLKAFVTIESVA